MPRSFPRCLRRPALQCSGAALAFLALAAGAAQNPSQLFSDEPTVWAETEVPPPPAFNTGRLIDIDMGPNVALKFGVDPKSVSIGTDDVIRYVLVASSPGGATTGLYEGIRCATAEVKTYARFNDGKWDVAKTAEWRPLINNAAYRHSLALAKQGGCNNTSPPRNADEMVRAMKDPRTTNSR